MKKINYTPKADRMLAEELQKLLESPVGPAVKKLLSAEAQKLMEQRIARSKR